MVGSGRTAPEPGSSQWTPTLAPSAGLATPSAAQLLTSVEAEEHVANVMRFRALILLGNIIWPLMAGVEWAFAEGIQRGSLRPLLQIRAGLMVVALASLLLLMRKRLTTPSELRSIDRYGLFSFSLAVGAMAVFLGGWKSPYFAGVLAVMGCRGALLAEPWRRGLLSNLGHPIACFVPLGVASLFSTELAAQLTDPAAQANIGTIVAIFVGLIALNVWGGHTLWATRRAAMGSGWLAQYRLDRQLGEGGMGVVWAAYHTGLRRSVAIKLIRPDRLDEENAQRRFEREVAAVSRLTSPHTVRIFDYGVDDQMRFFFAMEMLEGETLADLVLREGPLPPERALYFGVRVPDLMRGALPRKL